MTTTRAIAAGKTLTAADILQVSDIEIVEVPVPEWGGKVHVKALSGLERERYLESIRKIQGYGKKERTLLVHQLSSARLAQMTICDEQGNLLFTTKDIEGLAKKSARALQRIVDASAKLNGLGDDDEADLKNDSPATSDDSSSSGSPDTSERRGEDS